MRLICLGDAIGDMLIRFFGGDMIYTRRQLSNYNQQLINLVIKLTHHRRLGILHDRFRLHGTLSSTRSTLRFIIWRGRGVRCGGDFMFLYVWWRREKRHGRG